MFGLFSLTHTKRSTNFDDYRNSTSFNHSILKNNNIDKTDKNESNLNQGNFSLILKNIEKVLDLKSDSIITTTIKSTTTKTSKKWPYFFPDFVDTYDYDKALNQSSSIQLFGLLPTDYDGGLVVDNGTNILGEYSSELDEPESAGLLVNQLSTPLIYILFMLLLYAAIIFVVFMSALYSHRKRIGYNYDEDFPDSTSTNSSSDEDEVNEEEDVRVEEAPNVDSDDIVIEDSYYYEENKCYNEEEDDDYYYEDSEIEEMELRKKLKKEYDKNRQNGVRKKRGLSKSRISYLGRNKIYRMPRAKIRETDQNSVLNSSFFLRKKLVSLLGFFAFRKRLEKSIEDREKSDFFEEELTTVNENSSMIDEKRESNDQVLLDMKCFPSVEPLLLNSGGTSFDENKV